MAAMTQKLVNNDNLLSKAHHAGVGRHVLNLELSAYIFKTVCLSAAGALRLLFAATAHRPRFN